VSRRPFRSDNSDVPAGLDPAVIEALAALVDVRRDPQRSAAGRARVMAAAATARESARRGRGFRWRRRVAIGALGLAGANLALTGVVALAAGAQPDSILYGVKRAAEAAKLSLTFDPQDKARLELDLADRRAAEAEAMARTGHAQLALDAARDATSLVTQASATLSANPSVENQQALQHASAEARARLEQVFAALESGADPGAAEAARSLDATWSRGLGGTQGGGASQASPGAAGGHAGGSGGAGGPPNGVPTQAGGPGGASGAHGGGHGSGRAPGHRAAGFAGDGARCGHRFASGRCGARIGGRATIAAAPMSSASEQPDDRRLMRRALALARAAGARGEVPVGALAVLQGKVIASASNRMERAGDATAHAELIVLRRAAQVVGGWRLSGVTVVVTLEPCPMCAGAMVQARVDRCVYGARDPKKGADGSVYDVLRNPRNNHLPVVTPGVLADESGELLSGFFRGLRQPKVARTRSR
jgi:tRNA(adenine34) deaminase